MKLLHLCACVALAAGCVDDSSAQTEAASTVGSGSGHMCKPPQEAFDACANLTADAACAFDIDGHHVDGTCRTGPDGNGPLACAPKLRPPPPEAFDACASSTAGASCAFDIDGHHVDGTCRTGPAADDPLACVPEGVPPPP
jgi:hypothetical protein